MGPHLTLGAGLLGLAWWLLSRTFKRAVKVKVIACDKPLTVREPDELSVLCYNTLADNLVKEIANYSYANELYRSWEYRFNKLKEQMEMLHADVVCLQEIEIEKWGEWMEFMDNEGYTGVILKRPKSPRKTGRHQGITNATFFRSRRFTLCWEKHCSRVLGIALKWYSGDGREHKVYIVNVHLEGHPYKPAERVRQVNTIIRTIEKEQAGSAEEPDIVFCGDFNSTRWNAPWHYLYCGKLEGGYTEPFYPDKEVVKETISHSFALHDVYKAADIIPEFTARAPRRRTEADFIFASRHLRVAGVLRALDPRLVPYVDRTLLPNKHFPSDHLPVGVVLLQPKQSEMHLRSHRSTVYRYSADLDSTFHDSVSGSGGSDSANNIELHASVESLDSNGGITIHSTARRSHRFLDDTALT